MTDSAADAVASVIHVSELTRRFGATMALDSVSVSMPRGAVYGLVGANGAGKTTLIKHILGLLRAEHGAVRVFDPVADPVGVLSRIGYLSEEHDLPGWMRIDELLLVLARVLLRVGRCVCGGAARGLRAGRHGDDQQPLQGAEGARRATGRPRPSARAPRAGRAVVRPRPRGASRYSRRGHAHHRRRRPDRALLVTPAGGSRAGCRPRDDDQSGRDRPERAAGHHQAIAPVGDRAVLGIAASAPVCRGVLRWDGGGREWTAVYRDGAAELRDTVATWGASIVTERVPSLDEIFVAHVGTPATLNPQG